MRMSGFKLIHINLVVVLNGLCVLFCFFFLDTFFLAFKINLLNSAGVYFKPVMFLLNITSRYYCQILRSGHAIICL